MKLGLSALAIAGLCFIAVSARMGGEDNERDLSSGQALCSASPSSPLDVIVVGAGLAGLTAAKALADNGKSFIVVERLSEVGGRIRSINASEHGLDNRGDFLGILEAGANWMNGGRGKSVGRPQPVKTLADEFDVEYYDQSFYEIQMFKEGTELRWNELKKELQKADRAYECLGSSGVPLYDAYYAGSPIPETQSAKVTLNDCGWTPADEVEQVLEEYYIGSEFLTETDDLSSFNFPDTTYSDFGSGDSFATDQETGLQGIPKSYSEAFLTEGNDLFLSTKVEMIDYSGDSAIVSVTDSTDKMCNVTAPTVIYTPSLGILERYKDSGFMPSINTTTLPLAMGTWTKVFFQFETSFWVEEHQWIMLATDKETCKIWLNYDYYWNKWTKLLPGSNILACLMDENAVSRFNGGDTIDVNNSTQADGLLEGLKGAFGTLPDYKAYATNWLDEEKFGSLGSWENWKYDPTTMNIGIDQYYDFFNARGGNGQGRLIISGSASCLRYWGTMTGAYFAGIKSAEWALNFMNGITEPPSSICDDP